MTEHIAECQKDLDRVADLLDRIQSAVDEIVGELSCAQDRLWAMEQKIEDAP